MLGRPSTQRQDIPLTLAETAPGRYEAHAAALPAGTWLIALEARTAADAEPGLPFPEAPVAQPMTLADTVALRPLSPTGAAIRPCRVPRCVVENMHCGGCMRKVERRWRACRVSQAPASTCPPGASTAVHAGAAVSATDLVDGLERAGFKASELPDDGRLGARADHRPRFPAPRRRRRLRRRQHHAAVGLGVVGRGRRHVAAMQALFHWCPALIALPAIAYAGQPFFALRRAALSDRAGSTWTCRSRWASCWPRP